MKNRDYSDKIRVISNESSIDAIVGYSRILPLVYSSNKKRNYTPEEADVTLVKAGTPMCLISQDNKAHGIRLGEYIKGDYAGNNKAVVQKTKNTDVFASPYGSTLPIVRKLTDNDIEHGVYSYVGSSNVVTADATSSAASDLTYASSDDNIVKGVVINRVVDNRSAVNAGFTDDLSVKLLTSGIFAVPMFLLSKLSSSTFFGNTGANVGAAPTSANSGITSNKFAARISRIAGANYTRTTAAYVQNSSNVTSNFYNLLASKMQFAYAESSFPSVGKKIVLDTGGMFAAATSSIAATRTTAGTDDAEQAVFGTVVGYGSYDQGSWSNISATSGGLYSDGAGFDAKVIAESLVPFLDSTNKRADRSVAGFAEKSSAIAKHLLADDALRTVWIKI